MKYITFTVPCYNSENYLERCVDSLLPGGEEVEIILVDDGSTDRTGAMIDAYEASYPGIVRAVHKENGGHGSGVNMGLDLATGVYFKVVDSDGWLDGEAYRKLLRTIRKHVDFTTEKPLPDLYITNYVYNHLDEGKIHRRIFYNLFPEEKLCTWEDMGRVFPSQSIIMHALTYRTGLLRDCGVRLPEHTFFVDNILAFEPLPYAEHLYYMNVDLYQYYIGRADQSVNEKMLIKRLDQYVRVVYHIMDHTDPDEVKQRHPKLERYLVSFLTLMVGTVSTHYVMEDTPEAIRQRNEFWEGIRQRNPELYRHIAHSTVGRATHLSTRAGNKILLAGYRLAKKYYKFQ
ncbi:MAG: glycosyltransferase [Clostridiales bacterium]|nr:glycosyltransferase [Clostridiales bacterium]